MGATWQSERSSVPNYTNLVWFQMGLYAVAALYLLSTVDSILSDGEAFAVVDAMFALVSITIASSFSDRPSLWWYAGMGWIGLLTVLRFPLSLFYGVPVLYFGLTSWSAIFDVAGRNAAENRSAPTSRSRDQRTGSTSSRESSPDTADTADERVESAETAEAPGSDGPRGRTPAISYRRRGGGESGEAPNEEREVAGSDDRTDDTDADGEESTGETDDVCAAESDPVADYRDALTAADPETRREAVRDVVDDAATTSSAESAVAEALTERLESDDSTAVRVAACENLGRLDTDRSRSALEAHRLDPDTEVSRAASRALRNDD